MFRLALPNKGRLADATLELLDEAGLGAERPERALSAMIGDVAAREESKITSIEEIPPGTRIAIAFPRLAADFFARARKDVEMVPVSGATESAPRLGIADAIVDLTSTGWTLRGNGLREIATVLTSTARLIVRDTGFPTERAVGDVRIALESVLRARGMSYLMANVPRDRLGDLKSAVPGMDGPTISEILNGGRMVAVHAVVPTNRVYRAVADIKGLGGSAILVTRIEAAWLSAVGPGNESQPVEAA